MEKAYEKYKDSDVEWIGEIPESWEIGRLYYFTESIGSGSTPKSDNLKYYNGDISWLNTGDLNDGEVLDSSKYITQLALNDYSALKIFPKNSVVIALYGATIGKLGIIKKNMATNQACCVINPDESLNSQFLFYFLLASRNFLLSLAYGGGQPNISQDIIKKLHIPFVGIKEQTQIAAYLDYHTQLIDTLISKKETLIQKLQEQRQAIINEAVTKGLNKNVELKDSGIEWLGEIPKHWEVVKLKFLGESITGITYSPNDVSEKGTLVLRSSNIQKGKLDLQDTVYVNKKIADKYISQKGDILLCSRNGSRNLIGKNIILDERVENETWGAFMTVYRSNFNDFIYYFFNSDIFSALSSLFLSSTINQLTIGVLNNMQIAFPKKQKEREQIVHYLKQETEETNTTIYKIQTSIQKLKDYRESLISEAVTGKIDVRDWQKPNS
ncbi:restriction endonuclease subunit S [Ichthyenterobacterium magnum]|uniref:Type I restriction enzyme S subunit n=1 Tax=Ichthyenterobacterium magnum TaxID=1230530 RepID=A0A420DEL4_9FLAO|nr:restriction endonuclease subunit S [Ichthyenterobacterium magnum]RKE90274.1 type I restriction enzyme S subunit [Ichthyenterobacterium magnum]